MALIKQEKIDLISIDENKGISYRIKKEVLEDGVFLSASNLIISLIPGQDLTNVPTEVSSICDAAWTAEVISNYKALQE